MINAIAKAANPVTKPVLVNLNLSKMLNTSQILVRVDAARKSERIETPITINWLLQNCEISIPKGTQFTFKDLLPKRIDYVAHIKLDNETSADNLFVNQHSLS